MTIKILDYIPIIAIIDVCIDIQLLTCDVSKLHAIDLQMNMLMNKLACTVFCCL